MITKPQIDNLSLSVLDNNDQHLAQSINRIGNFVEKQFDRLETKNGQTDKKFDYMLYFIIFDIIISFLILATMRSWF